MDCKIHEQMNYFSETMSAQTYGQTQKGDKPQQCGAVQKATKDTSQHLNQAYHVRE